jgi:hypothetical protein
MSLRFEFLRFVFWLCVLKGHCYCAKRREREATGKRMQAVMTLDDATTTRQGPSRRGARALVRARLRRRALACLFAVSLPVVALLMAGWMAWLRGERVVGDR